MTLFVFRPTVKVTIEGAGKRPGIFEMKRESRFLIYYHLPQGLLRFASVNVLQKTAKEFKVQDITSSEFKSYKPLSGDVFRVTKILNRFENRIRIDGAVFRPNTYSFMKACAFLI
jgi:protein involved in polysaccharide export with SLBB domain